MKRVELIKRLRQIAKERGYLMELTEGGRHSMLRFDGRPVTPIPRHNEIEQNTANGILREAQKWQKR